MPNIEIQNLPKLPPPPPPTPNNLSLASVQKAEQSWALAESYLNEVLTKAREFMPQVTELTGGMQDASVTFDWVTAYLMYSIMVSDQRMMLTVVALCATAITRLMREDDRMSVSTVLTEMEKEMKKK